MGRLSSFLLIIFFILIFECIEEPPDWQPEVPKITEIKFGKDFDPNSNQIKEPDTVFPLGTKKIYYSITFEKQFGKGYMIKKKWNLNNSQLLEAVMFVPAGKIRIVGEFHRYDTTDMNIGTYELFVYYLDGDYKEFSYASSVNKKFKIENLERGKK